MAAVAAGATARGDAVIEPAWSLVDLLVGSGADLAAAGAVGAELVERHAEPHRRHHDEEHVEEVLAELRRLLVLEPGADPRATEVAAWFHDAVHGPTDPPGASEAASAALARTLLEPLQLVDGERLVVEVDRLVRLTASHVVDEHDRSGAVLVDADLWILQAPPVRYARYVADVRAEYAHVDDDGWRAGRGAVLRHLLAGIGSLYGAGPEDDRAERRARAAANLEGEWAALEASRPT